MAQYIDKAAVVAEIERRVKSLNKDMDFNYLQIKELEALLSSLNTLEVKEVNLEKSISDWLSEGLPNDEEEIDYIKETAKHFFELGIKSKSSYIGIPNIDDTLKEMGIDPDSKSAESFKEFYYMALEKFKAQKGE